MPVQDNCGKRNENGVFPTHSAVVFGLGVHVCTAICLIHTTFDVRFNIILNTLASTTKMCTKKFKTEMQSASDKISELFHISFVVVCSTSCTSFLLLQFVTVYSLKSL